MSRRTNLENLLRSASEVQRALLSAPRAAMSSETKFGYGFTLVGIGLPFLLEKVFGLTVASTASVACVIFGVAFLIAGHRHEEKKRLSFREKIVTVLACCTMIFMISSGIMHRLNTQQANENLNEKPSIDNVHLAKWGLLGNMNVYGVLETHDLQRFQNRYRLILAARTYRASFDWQDDPWVEKSGLFTIEDEVTIQIPLSEAFKNRVLVHRPAIVFFYGIVPVDVNVQNAHTLKELIDAGAFIRLGGSML